MPKGADNLMLVLDAARDVFLRNGFSATSMDAVARAAGVSKATVYAYFGSKDELFAAMVEREGEEQTVALSTATTTDTAGALRQFGTEAAKLLLSAPVIAIQRIVASEANRSPDIGRLFYANGPNHLIEGLAIFLDQAMRGGDLRAAPPRTAAAQFLAIIVGDLQLRALLGLAPASHDEQQQIVSSGVDVFLRGYEPQLPSRTRRR